MHNVRIDCNLDVFFDLYIDKHNEVEDLIWNLLKARHRGDETAIGVFRDGLRRSETSLLTLTKAKAAYDRRMYGARRRPRAK